MLTDIQHINDIKKIVDYQYDKLLNDADTGPKFKHLHLEEHLPTIYTFWAFIVLGGEHSYKGNAFQKHESLGLKEIHFEKWMKFLNEAIFTHFAGSNADKLWNQAKTFETIFRAKLIK
ncbi:MAG: group III truncated hemoglobin [Flavobacteriales bacterium]